MKMAILLLGGWNVNEMAGKIDEGGKQKAWV
jgi:hypothetical protein